MRTFVLFALALTGLAFLVDDASAIGRRNRGSSGGCCGAPAQASSCCGGGVASGGGYGMAGAAYGGSGAGSCCGGSSMTYTGGYPGTTGYPGGMIGAASGTTVNGKQTVIRATDGSVYALGSDGHYYPANSGISTMGGFTTQPYYGTSGYRSFYYPSGVYPAGYGAYPGYPGIYPAGGTTTTPLTMPGVNLPGGITIVPTPMPNK